MSYTKAMQVKSESTERVALFISRKHREKLNELAEVNHRGQRNQVEYMIDKEYKKL